MFDAFMPVFCVLTMEILWGVIPCVFTPIWTSPWDEQDRQCT